MPDHHFEENEMKRRLTQLSGAILFAALGLTAHASSHREALAVLNEPCADNTDTYAWVAPGAHDKLYLIMNFNPLHEPGQGNQGLRACNGYRYEFHIGKGESLRSRVIYRVEFTNTLPPQGPPNPTDTVGGPNELLWQLTGGTETMTVTRVSGGLLPGNLDALLGNFLEDVTEPGGGVVLGRNLPVLPNNHGPQTDRLVYGLRAFQGYDAP